MTCEDDETSPCEKGERMKHTPGPWGVYRKQTAVGQVFMVGKQEHVESGHGAICLYDDRTALNPHNDGVQEANARLVAAAPKMLEALEAILRMEGDFTSPEVFFYDARAIARDAIAKVRGE